MHVHTSVASFCSRLSPQDLIERALRLKLDGVCITEHSSQRGVEETTALAAESGLLVFKGMEVYSDLGDMLVFGLTDGMRHHTTPFVTLKQMVDKVGGVIIPAHPCRGLHDLDKWYGPEAIELLMASVVAIETHNGGNQERGNVMAEKLRERHGIKGIGGSDAHGVDAVGKCVTVFEADFSDDAGLIEQLRSGEYRACYLRDLHRQDCPEIG